MRAVQDRSSTDVACPAFSKKFFTWLKYFDKPIV